jgi:membrane protein implicated in regulation of membrane protease activity
MGEAQAFMASFAPYFWLFVAISAAVVEGVTLGLVSIWFVPGALAAMLLSFFVPAVGWQIAVFLAVSVATLVLTKTVFRKYLPQSRSTRMNADSLIGDHAVVVEEINNLRETGSVKINALVWTARSTDNAVIIPAGSLVKVEAIEGVKLICSIYVSETEKES